MIQEGRPSELSTGKRPMDELLSLRERVVVVKLKNGMSYRGMLLKVDNYMNIYLQNAEEFDENGKMIASYGDVIIRGNNILYVEIPTISL
ncbi:MAG: LSM domain-containing protein [Nitrososphaeria archaeon]